MSKNPSSVEPIVDGSSAIGINWFEFLNLLPVFISVFALLISIITVVYSVKAIRQARLQSLFSAFNEASKLAIDYPYLAKKTHGIASIEDEEELKAIFYLGYLLDGFQQFYSEHYSGNFSKMADHLIIESNYLTNLLAVPENKERWKLLKPVMYGDFDKSFVDAIDRLLEHYSTH